MQFSFERGTQEEPKGHALLYFTSSSDPDEIWATYVVVLPITVDVSKYVPPFLMSQVKELGPQDLSAFAFPPAPERLGGRDALDRLAAARNDDVLFGGSINPEDVPSGMMAVNDAVQHYTEVYSNVVGIDSPPGEQEEQQAEDDDATGVSEVIYGLMSDRDKLNELTKLVSRLRFGIEGADSRTVTEAEQDITVLSRHLPANHGRAPGGFLLLRVRARSARAPCRRCPARNRPGTGRCLHRPGRSGLRPGGGIRSAGLRPFLLRLGRRGPRDRTVQAPRTARSSLRDHQDCRFTQCPE